MIEPYTQKVFFIDEPFLDGLKHKSLTAYQAFTAPEVDTKVITLPAAASSINELVQWVHPSDIRVGGVLAKASYTDQFVSVDVFSEDLAMRKYRLWVLLCLALGAKDVSVSNIESVSLEAESTSQTSAQVAGKAPVGHVEAGFAHAKTDSSDEVRKAIMNIKAEAMGGEPNLVEAQRILNQYALHKDDMFRSIYDMRSVSSNTLTKHEFSLDLSADIKKVFDASLKAKVKAMSALYEGHVEFDTIKKSLEKEQTALKLSVSVKF